ncbi:FAD-dependent monooxygenase [Mycobacterium camsae]|uniref:FAD-dependent monooxygenase n=1 Tax=Mycobacterium gordonae TaxID=1778 RepID=UPI00197FBA10|nr:FAD-dependent monooxygenase [Mycobacterium gordonae]
MVDVVIAGAGPNGLMLACELAMAGVDPVVLDPMPGPNPHRRANGIVGQGVRILDHRGLYSALAGTDEPPQPVPGSSFGAFSLDFADVADPQLFILHVEQPRLVEVLVQRARELDVEFRWGHGLDGFDDHDNGVTVQVAGPDGRYELATRYLIGADGGTSLTRKLAGIEFAGTSSYDVVERMAFGVVPPDDWVDPVSGALHVPGVGPVPSRQFVRTDRGIFAWGMLAGQAVVFTIELQSTPREEPDPAAADASPMTLTEHEGSVERLLGAAVPLRSASPEVPPDLRRFSGMNSRIASRYRCGRVILVGDSAHVHFALGGPGLNLGLQDAVNLGWKLAAVLDGRVGPELLDTYEAERRPVAERLIMHSRAQLALIRPGPEITALRELFGELLTIPGVIGHLGDLVSGADTRYGTEADHPWVGRWVPDFAVSGPVGVRRVAELARDGKPMLIDLTEGAVVAAAAAGARPLTVAAGQPVGEVAARAVLVRPDGYVAWASSSATPDVDGLRSALTRWFGIKMD